MKRIYLCSRYAGETAPNEAVAKQLCRKAIEAGHAPFAPHLISDISSPLRAPGSTTVACSPPAKFRILCPPSSSARSQAAGEVMDGHCEGRQAGGPKASPHVKAEQGPLVQPLGRCPKKDAPLRNHTQWRRYLVKQALDGLCCRQIHHPSEKEHRPRLPVPDEEDERPVDDHGRRRRCRYDARHHTSRRGGLGALLVHSDERLVNDILDEEVAPAIHTGEIRARGAARRDEGDRHAERLQHLGEPKVRVGFVQAATENERVCRRFLSDLVERGMQYEAGLLVVIDGAKGLYKAVMSVLKGHACVQRCQYHKRQNVVSYLSKSEQSGMGRKMEAAYGKPRYEAAKAALDALKPGLKLMNQSALHSLEEGMEETLTLHRLGLTPMRKDSFRTTNCIENVNSLLEQLTHNVRRWTNSSQRHRWVATALLDIEPRLRRVKGYRHLPMLRQAIQAELGIKQLAMMG